MYKKQFDLRYFEMGQHGEATPVTILTLLEEAAADHCLSIGYSLYDLLEKGIGWGLLSERMKMNQCQISQKLLMQIEKNHFPINNKRFCIGPQLRNQLPDIR
ncbi:hypothetical protein [Fodinibius halophilus]|uniref:Uncharacterized protein n=1 Tax=Fodinibius halophilus TaxID=1736908 RepID=A0A6M1T622_9BACT|nr:hypothetical protein [Fodinibius halophilus]NGP88735.1 hypothetical protein [Fodinibius halophilus]